MKEDMFSALADSADRMDAGSVMKRWRLQTYIKNRFDSWNTQKQQTVVASYRAGTIGRRDFLKLLGLVGGGVIAATIGFGILPEQETRRITGRAAGCNPDVIQVNGSEDFDESVNNSIIDITAPGSGCNIRVEKDSWTVENIGFRGMQEGQGTHGYLVSGTCPSPSGTATVRNIYAGGGSEAHHNHGGFFARAGHRGVIDVENVYIAGMADNGLYSTVPATEHAQEGIVNVRNSYFENNNVCNIRVAGDDYRSPGAVVENCSVYARESELTPLGNGGTNVQAIRAEHGTVTVRNCRINVDGTAFATLEDYAPERAGNFDQENNQVGQDVETPVPQGTPTSPEEAACGTSTATGTAQNTAGSQNPC